MNFNQFILFYNIIPNIIGFVYTMFYTFMNKSNQPKNKLKLSLKWTVTHLFVTSNIIGYLFYKLSKIVTPSLLSNNCYSDNTNIFIKCLIFIIDFYIKTFISSLFFYTGHRILHTPYLYKNFHKQHHKYVNTAALAAFDVGFFEFIFVYIPTGLIPFFSCYIMFQKPCINVWSSYIHSIFSILYSVYIHVPKPSKYDPLRLWPFCDFKNHHLHHKFVNCNYSSPANDLPDILFGTLKKIEIKN